MIKIILTLLIIFSSINSVFSQNQDDAYFKHHTSDGKLAKNNVSTFGHYLYGGLGSSFKPNMPSGFARSIGYSLAYKTHLFSLTSISFASDLASHKDYLGGNFTSILLGESYRAEKLLISISSGISFTETSYHSTVNQIEKSEYKIKTLVPLELKIFILSYRTIGVGVHFTKTLASYTPYIITFSLVIGHWNN